MENLYDIIGVESNATEDQIKKAYYKRAKQLHPDREGGDAEKMKALTRAYEILKDKDKRARYDRTGEVDEAPRSSMIDNMMAHMFCMAVSQSGENYKYKDVIKKAKGIAYEAMTGQRRSIKKAKDSIKVFEDLIARLTTKENAPNIIAAKLAGQVEADKWELADMEEHLEMLTEAHNLFDNYQFNKEPGEPPKEEHQHKSFKDILDEIMKTNPMFGSM